MMRTRSPRIAEMLLRLVRPDLREFIAGDLDEERAVVASMDRSGKTLVLASDRLGGPHEHAWRGAGIRRHPRREMASCAPSFRTSAMVCG
jgi:hypothetical protein